MNWTYHTLTIVGPKSMMNRIEQDLRRSPPKAEDGTSCVITDLYSGDKGDLTKIQVHYGESTQKIFSAVGHFHALPGAKSSAQLWEALRGYNPDNNDECRIGDMIYKPSPIKNQVIVTPVA